MIKYYEHYSLRLVKCQYLFLRTLLIFIDPEDPNLLHADCSGSENLDFHVHRVGGGHQIRFVEETYAALSIRSSRLMHGFFLSSDDSYAWDIYSFAYMIIVISVKRLDCKFVWLIKTFQPSPFKEWWRVIKWYLCLCMRSSVCTSVHLSEILCPLNNF